MRMSNYTVCARKVRTTKSALMRGTDRPVIAVTTIDELSFQETESDARTNLCWSLRSAFAHSWMPAVVILSANLTSRAEWDLPGLNAHELDIFAERTSGMSTHTSALSHTGCCDLRNRSRLRRILHRSPSYL